MPQSGIELARAYYEDVVGPIVTGRFPQLAYAAARLGSGSDALGLDDEMSRDHDWGLRVNLLVDQASVDDVRRHLEAVLPPDYAGWPTRFATTWDPAVVMRVQVDAPVDFLRSRLGIDPTSGLSTVEWLSLTGQAVLEVTTGEVFADTEGVLTTARERLRWYPDDLWRYVIAADWARLAQELPVASRAGQRGDDLGSRVVMGRLVSAAIHLAFLLERRWPPYAKWLGTVFQSLACSAAVARPLEMAMAGATWQEREAGLAHATDLLLERQRALGLPTASSAVQRFYDRPLRGVRTQVAQRLLDSVEDQDVRDLPAGVGSVEQWVDNVDVLVDHERRLALVRARVRI